MTEVIFEVCDDPECGLRARALGYPIFTQGEDMEELQVMIRDAVRLYFEENMNLLTSPDCIIAKWAGTARIYSNR